MIARALSCHCLYRVTLACFASAVLLSGAGARPTRASLPRSPNPVGPPAVAPPNVQAFDGVWDVVNSALKSPVPHQGDVPLTPTYEAIRARLQAMDQAGKAIPGSNAKCIPDGMPNMMVFGFQIAADAQRLLVVGGTGPSIRQIMLGRTSHTPDDVLFPSYAGESIAHWNRGDLVVDTTGLKPGNEIFYAMPANDDTLHVIERWHMVSPATLRIVTTINDKAALTRPWTYSNVYGRRPLNTEIRYCVSAGDPFKNGTMDLTPPAGGYVPPGFRKPGQ